MEEFRREGERLDDLQVGGLYILQDPKAFCFGMDAVLLAHFARIRKGERVLDLCTGSGIIPLLLCAHTKAAHITGVEIQPEIAQRAARSVLMNKLEQRVSILQGDLRDPSVTADPLGYHHVTVNPPYQPLAAGKSCEDTPRRIARQEVCCTLAQVVQCASRNLKDRGRFTMVHRPERLDEIMCCLHESHLVPKRVQLVQPKAGEAPNMVLIESIKNGAPGLKWQPVLNVYGEDGRYTSDLLKCYGK